MDIFSLIYPFSCLSPSVWEAGPRSAIGRAPDSEVRGPGFDSRSCNILSFLLPLFQEGRVWPGGAMVLGKRPVPGRPTIWITVGQGPTALAVGAGGVCLDIFTLIYPFFPLSHSLWETARYRLKYCLKFQNQPTNQQIQEGQLSVTGESMCTKYWLTA